MGKGPRYSPLQCANPSPAPATHLLCSGSFLSFLFKTCFAKHTHINKPNDIPPIHRYFQEACHITRMSFGVKSTFSHKRGAPETSAFRSLSPLPSNYSSTFPLFLQVPPTVPRASVRQTSQHHDQLLHWMKTLDSMGRADLTPVALDGLILIAGP